MNEFLIVSDILENIITHHLSFSDALKQGIETHNASNKQGIIRSLTSCELHHHRLLDHVVNRFVPNLTLKDRLYVQATMGNNVFLRRIPTDQVIEALQVFLKERNVEDSSIQALVRLAHPKQALIDDQIKEQSVPYLAIKYNTPEWLVLMWIKHFGFATTIKILATNNKPVIQACRINTLKISTKNFLQRFPEFQIGPLDNTVIYLQKEPLKNHIAYKENLLFQQRLAVTDVINQFSFANVKGQMLIVETRPQALYLEMPIYTEKQIKIQVITNAIERKLIMQKTLKAFAIENVSVVEAEPDKMLSHVSQKQDVVIVVPQCSKFDLIRSLPDFFIHFKQEDLDSYIQQQMLTLSESSVFVETGGLLFYGVNTLNHKEGKLMIQEFSETHPDFKLIHEVQYFPFEPLNTALYVAVLRKQKS